MKILYISAIVMLFTFSIFAQNKVENSVDSVKNSEEKVKTITLKDGDKKESGNTTVENDEVEEKVPYSSKYFNYVSNKAKKQSLVNNYFIKSDKVPLPENFNVKDVKNDGGGVLAVSWSYNEGVKNIDYFEIVKKVKGEKDFSLVSKIDFNHKKSEYSINDQVDDDSYIYMLKVYYQGLYNQTNPHKAIASDWSIFDTQKTTIFIAAILLSVFIVSFIKMARSGKDLYIRRIAGLDAVDDAVGRATEMGREIMFIPGIMDIDDPQTIAGLTILGRVAKLTARYKTPLSVPVSKSMVMITGREIVKESYLSAGRPENFQEGMVYYLTDDQFGFAAGVDGVMVREKPATVFLQGTFFAESLILAETGHHIGAIQIAGTAAPSQLPFFITSCDYTLIGEELYAASAYLSKEPQLLGSLRGQDLGKALILIAIILGILLETIGHATGTDWLSIKDWFSIK